jgi:hypothetical protein
MEGFTIKCNRCGSELQITPQNIRQFINYYDWGTDRKDFKLDDIDIGVFETYDTCNGTMICKCGNEVQD